MRLPDRPFKIKLVWSGGFTVGKTTEVSVKPKDSIYDLKQALCTQEPSLSMEAVRLSVGSAALGKK